MPVETELYELLEISFTASQDEIKKAYRRKALMHHPDKGGDPEVFKKINSANEILSDPAKREIYDRHGKNGLKSTPGIPEDVLSAMFGNMMGFNPFGMFNQARNHVRKTPPVLFGYKVSLEDLCTRKVVKLRVIRSRLCDCINTSTPQSCVDCSGKGVRVEVRQLGPFQQHVQHPCNTCSSTGKIYSTCEKCKNTAGSIEDPKVFELFLTPDLPDKHRYTFSNDGNHLKGHEPGDFIVVLEYVQHPAFKLENKNLLYTHTLSLKDALVGHTLYLTHPSGEAITTKSDLVNPESIFVYPGKGLTQDGNLEIRYKIVFPDSLSKDQIETLSKIL